MVYGSGTVPADVHRYVLSSSTAKYGLTRKGCFSRSWSAKQVKWIFPRPLSRLISWSHETDPTLPSSYSLLILHTQTEPCADSLGFSRFSGRRACFCTVKAIGSIPNYQVTQLRTDFTDCRASAGIEPVVLKIVSEAGATFSGIIMDRFLCTTFPPHAHKVKLTCAIQEVSGAIETVRFLKRMILRKCGF